MSTRPQLVPDADDRLQEYASISAGHAANALAGVFDRVVLMDPPACRWLAADDLAASVFEGEAWIAAVFVDLSEPATGQAGIVLERKVAVEILERMVGGEAADALDERQCSALAEIGNISLSAAANALGALHRAIVLPSVPRVRYGSAGRVFAEAVRATATQPVYVTDARLTDRAGSLRARFVWIPETPPGSRATGDAGVRPSG